MISNKILKVKTTPEQYNLLPVKVKPDTTWDGETVIFTAHEFSGSKWRLVYTGKKVLGLIEGADGTVTTTAYECREFDTKQSALDWIKKNNYEEPEGDISD